MSDITLSVNELLKPYEASSLLRPKPYSLDHLNEFLKEAYQINVRISELTAYLRSIRRSYLSTAPPPRQTRYVANGIATKPQHENEPVYLTHPQRDSIDAEAKSTLRDIHAAVTQLSQAGRVEHEATFARIQLRRKKRGFGALGRWAAGGVALEASPEEEAEEQAASQVKEHRDGVLWFLQLQLRECGQMQSLMMETRITREVEKNKSMLHKSRAAMPRPTTQDHSREDGSLAARSRGKSEASGVQLEELEQLADVPPQPQFSQEQMALFAEENEDMLKLYEGRLDQVREAERSLTEISELQSTLAQNLEVQSEHIEQLSQDSYSAAENLGRGNKELKKASERRSTAKLAFFSTLGLCSVLVAWDLIT